MEETIKNLTNLVKKGCGTLYIVATPIGNLKDISLRALDILNIVDLIACEDTRETRKILSFYKINTKMISYHKFNEEKRKSEIVDLLKEGRDVALVSTAGTPCISDPGYKAISSASLHDYQIVPLPGPSSLSTILSVAHFEIKNFKFIGFFPKKNREQNLILNHLKITGETFIFFESPKRINKTLLEIFDILGDREIILGRELTKINEEIIRTNLKKIIDEKMTIFEKGEIVVIVKSKDEKYITNNNNNSEIESATKNLIDLISKEIGVSKSVVYREIARVKERLKAIKDL